MNTTTTAPDPGYYIPTPADCEEAGLKLGLFRPSDTAHAKWDGGDATIVWEPLTGPTLKHHSDESQDRELVFANRDACMAFLRNHMVTAADQPASMPVKGKIIMPATLEDANMSREEFQHIWDEAITANPRKMWEAEAATSDWNIFISAFDQITVTVDEHMEFVLKTHYGACAVLFAHPSGDYSTLVDKTVTSFKDLQAKISAYLAAKSQDKASNYGGAN